jgi:hypothetical protein
MVIGETRMPEVLLLNVPPNYGEMRLLALLLCALVVGSLCATLVLLGVTAKDLRCRGIVWTVRGMRRWVIGVGMLLGVVASLVPGLATTLPREASALDSITLVVLGANLLLGTGGSSLVVMTRIWLSPRIHGVGKARQRRVGKTGTGQLRRVADGSGGHRNRTRQRK